MLPEPTESNVVYRELMDVAVDSSDNAYVVRRLKIHDENGEKKYELVLYVFDENYNIKNVSVLHFLTTTLWSPSVKVAVDQNQNLYMITDRDNQVYVCNNAGKLKSKFKQDGRYTHRLSISNNDVMIVSEDPRAVQIHTSEGDLKSTIKVPEGHQAQQMAFHHGMCKIIVLTYAPKQESWFMLSYPEKGELENSMLLNKRDYCVGDLCCHPQGPCAFLVNGIITFV